MFTIPSHSVMGGLPTFFINHHGTKCSQVAGDSLAGDAPLSPRPPPLDRAPRSGRSAARRSGPGDREIWVEIFVPSVYMHRPPAAYISINCMRGRWPRSATERGVKKVYTWLFSIEWDMGGTCFAPANPKILGGPSTSLNFTPKKNRSINTGASPPQYTF
jgi:hypothetical protein